MRMLFSITTLILSLQLSGCTSYNATADTAPTKPLFTDTPRVFTKLSAQPTRRDRPIASVLCTPPHLPGQSHRCSGNFDTDVPADIRVIRWEFDSPNSHAVFINVKQDIRVQGEVMVVYKDTDQTEGQIVPQPPKIKSLGHDPTPLENVRHGVTTLVPAAGLRSLYAADARNASEPFWIRIYAAESARKTLVARWTSNPAPLGGQRHRSSGNVSVHLPPGTTGLRWEVGGANYPAIVFNVKEDRSGEDPLSIPNLRHGAGSVLMLPRNYYIADPRGAAAPFEVFLYALR